jgi:type IV pilus assembly protein PilC
MALYNYIAKNKEGQEVRSSLESGTRLEALEALRKKGLTVVDLFSVENGHPVALRMPLSELRKQKHGVGIAKKIKLIDLALLCRQLAISINAGVPLRDALESMEGDLEHPTLRRVLKDVAQKLNDGKSFSEAVASHPKVFNAMFCGLIRVAEESGTLPGTLAQLADYLERTEKLQRKVRSMAAYPSFIAGFFVLVCLVMTLFVVPKFTDIFDGLGANLPPLTQVVFSVNRFLLDNFILVAFSVFILFTVLVLYGRTDGGAYRKDRIKLNIPAIGTWIRKYVIARFCRNLSIMVHSGVPISTALEICSEASGNAVTGRALVEARDRILSGNSIASSLSQSMDFPRLLVRMVGVGEDSGRLPEVLDKIADMYEDQVETDLTTAMALFEPVVIAVFGGFILILVLAVYIPIFTVSSHI